MPIVPMRQEVTVHKPGGYDDWNNPLPGEEVTHYCRAVEQTETVTNNYGEEAVTTVRLLFDRLADITYDDTITYENELGVTVERKPQSIRVVRLISGRPIMTVVNV